jgi:hypothetical protein
MMIEILLVVFIIIVVMVALVFEKYLGGLMDNQNELMEEISEIKRIIKGQEDE